MAPISASLGDAMDTDIILGVASEQVAHIVDQMRDLSVDQLIHIKQQAIHLANAKAPFLRLPPKVRNIIYTYMVRDYLSPLTEKFDHNWLDSRQQPSFFRTCRLMQRECDQLFPVAPFQVLVLRNDRLYRLTELPSDWLSFQVGLSGLSRMKSDRPMDSMRDAEQRANELRALLQEQGHSSGVIVFREDLHIGPKAWYTYERPVHAG
jgi:hypothetical protein